MSIYEKDKMKQKVVYPTEQTPSYSDWNLFEMGKELEGVVSGLPEPVQSDWNETDDEDLAYIKNKPTIPVVPEYTTEEWVFTLADDTTVTKTVYLVPPTPSTPTP